MRNTCLGLLDDCGSSSSIRSKCYNQRKIVNACLVSICEAKLITSTARTRPSRAALPPSGRFRAMGPCIGPESVLKTLPAS